MFKIIFCRALNHFIVIVYQYASVFQKALNAKLNLFYFGSLTPKFNHDSTVELQGEEKNCDLKYRYSFQTSAIRKCQKEAGTSSLSKPTINSTFNKWLRTVSISEASISKSVTES